MRTRLLEVVAALDERGRQTVEQLVVAGGVGVAEIIDRLDDPPAHQVEPDAVGQALGEERILPARQPGGQVDAAVGLGVIEDGSAQSLGLHQFSGARLADLA